MNDKIEQEISQIKKDLLKTQVVGAPGMILVGLGLYGIYGAKGNAFHPFLNNLENCYSILAVGAAIAVWETIKVIQLTRRQSKLSKQLNT